MDDLLGKPVPLALLRQALLRWLPGSDQRGHVLVTDPDDAAGDALPDRAAVVRRFGSAHVATVLIDSLCTTSEEDLARLDAAVRDDARQATIDVLHRLVGALATLGADALATRARTLLEQVEQGGVAPQAGAIADFAAGLRAYLPQLQAS